MSADLFFSFTEKLNKQIIKYALRLVYELNVSFLKLISISRKQSALSETIKSTRKIFREINDCECNAKPF